MNKSKIKSYAFYIISALVIGGLSGFLTMKGIDAYQYVAKPSVTPPSFVFPIVWTILFILMGISAAMISMSDSPDKSSALKIYWFQLIVNFFWSIIFFNLQAYLTSFIWIIFLWLLIILMTASFYKINKTAAFLQIPYLLWVTFAAYLNLMVWLMNRA